MNSWGHSHMYRSQELRKARPFDRSPSKSVGTPGFSRECTVTVKPAGSDSADDSILGGLWGSGVGVIRSSSCFSLALSSSNLSFCICTAVSRAATRSSESIVAWMCDGGRGASTKRSGELGVVCMLLEPLLLAVKRVIIATAFAMPIGALLVRCFCCKGNLTGRRHSLRLVREIQREKSKDPLPGISL